MTLFKLLNPFSTLDYIELSVIVTPRDPFTDIITAQLADMGYESFVETEKGVNAYIPVAAFTDDFLSLLADFKDVCSYEFEKKVIKRQNWNQLWESNFQPVIVGMDCVIKAPFHTIPFQAKYEIIIEPKMSFGTGHHDTTYMMVEELLTLDVHSKALLDMGCGTGILAILAAKMGAASVIGIDIDDWSIENSIENINKNNTPSINVTKGDIDTLLNRTFSIILANINKNVLLKHLPQYARSILPSGNLLLSGFFDSDTDELIRAAESLGFVLLNKKTRNNWALIHLTKK